MGWTMVVTLWFSLTKKLIKNKNELYRRDFSVAGVEGDGPFI